MLAGLKGAKARTLAKWRKRRGSSIREVQKKRFVLFVEYIKMIESYIC